MKRIKVVIIEDSILMQKMIVDILAQDPAFEVVGKATTGREGIERVCELKPDIVTLDVRLPDIHGLHVLKEIVEKCPTRVVVISGYTQKGAETAMRALELGALDFIPKPSGEVSLDLYNFKDEIVAKIKAAAEVDMSRYLANLHGTLDEEKAEVLKKIVVIAASTGGPKVIIDFMKKIPANVNAAFLIVQHMPKGFTKSFAERVAWHSQIKIKEAEDGDVVLKGAGYIAPAGFHMVLEKGNQSGKAIYRIRLNEGPLVNFVRPSADITMSSAAEFFGKNTIGVILTGMGKDGLAGAEKIKAGGGYIIAQDQKSCVVYGMPSAVVHKGLADKVADIAQISQEVLKCL